MKKIVKDIKKEAIIDGLALILLVAISLYVLIDQIIKGSFGILFVIFLGSSIFLIWLFIKVSLLKFIKPFDDVIFKKYGGIKEVEKLINEILIDAHLYEDDRLIITKDYLLSKSNYSYLVKIEEIKQLEKYHKSQIKNEIGFMVFDGNRTYAFSYLRNRTKSLDEAFDVLSKIHDKKTSL